MFLEIKNPLMSLEHQHSDLAETNKAKKMQLFFTS